MGGSHRHCVEQKKPVILLIRSSKADKATLTLGDRGQRSGPHWGTGTDQDEAKGSLLGNGNALSLDLGGDLHGCTHK